jgi:hypothetical protein
MPTKCFRQTPYIFAGMLPKEVDNAYLLIQQVAKQLGWNCELFVDYVFVISDCIVTSELCDTFQQLVQYEFNRQDCVSK